MVNVGMAILTVVVQALVVEAGRREGTSAVVNMTKYFLLRQSGLIIGEILSHAVMHEGLHPHVVFIHAAIAVFLVESWGTSFAR